MEAAFERLDQLFDIVITQPRRKAESARSHDKWLLCRMLRRHQAQAKIVIYAFFERHAGAANLTVQQVSDVVIERQSSTHIFMLAR